MMTAPLLAWAAEELDDTLLGALYAGQAQVKLPDVSFIGGSFEGSDVAFSEQLNIGVTRVEEAPLGGPFNDNDNICIVENFGGNAAFLRQSNLAVSVVGYSPQWCPGALVYNSNEGTVTNRFDEDAQGGLHYNTGEESINGSAAGREIISAEYSALAMQINAGVVYGKSIGLAEVVNTNSLSVLNSSTDVIAGAGR